MDKKPGRRELSHERIVDAAARAVRRAGYQGVGVADVMREAGLTHGGFYAHFASRDALLAEAVARAGRDSTERMQAWIDQQQARGVDPFRALVQGYLSDTHLVGTEHGCPVAALASDIPRQPPDVQVASVERVRALVRQVHKTLPGASRGDALAIASTLVGALQLARALGDNPEGRAVLNATRHALLERHAPR